ncbi:hypothetical protein Slala02_41350 [Streptomyces lavendulae subsp. lavendulae]|nr:hypothetical protein Slala02_41350 [Streptomyces lavendulae subsp. lavendulae]
MAIWLASISAARPSRSWRTSCGGEVEAGVGADGGAELAHDGGGADSAAHDVADDEGGAAGAEGDDVVPVAADGRFGAAGLVGGGDAEVVGLFELLGQEGALEGDGCFALAAFAGAETVDGFGVVGDVGEVDEDAGVLGVRPVVGGGLGELDGGAGDGVRAAAAGGGAVLGGAGLAAALDLVEEFEEAELTEFGEGFAGGGAGGAGAEAGGVGVVDVGDAVVGAVDEGDEGREQAEDFPYGELVEGGRGGERCRAGAADGGVGGAAFGGRGGVGRGAAGCRDGALTAFGLGRGVLVPGGGAARAGEAGAPAREVHCVQASWCRKWSRCVLPVVPGGAPGVGR